MSLSRFVHSNLLRAAAGEYVRDYAHYFAGAMVYYALLSLVPLLVLLMAALGWVLRLSPVATTLEHQLLSTVEVTFGADLRVAVEQVSEYLQRGSIMATLIGVVGLLLTSSALFGHLRMTFRAIWKQAPPLASGSLLLALRMKLTERAIAFGIMFAGGAVLLALLAIIGTLQWLAALPGDLTLLGDTLGWLLPLLGSLVIAPLIFALLLRALPPAPVNWRDVRLAALLLGLTWIFGAEVLSVYAAHAAKKWSAYGAIGGILMVMLWMHALSKMLFFGAELSKVTHLARTSTGKTRPAPPNHPVHAPGTIAAVHGSSVD
ncbi:MAG TPA: YihY/virulence factor BrkB family protein [Steroidobacter sp.]